MTIEVAVALAFVGMVGFYRAGDYEAWQGERHNGLLWAALSALVSGIVFGVFGGGWWLWLGAQAGLLVGIAVVRVWWEDLSRK